MTADDQIKASIESTLRLCAAACGAGLEVAVRKGVVTLSGQLDADVDERALEGAVRHVAGVSAVVIECGAPCAPAVRDDADLATAALSALRWVATLPAKVGLKVEGGWITLVGSVDDDYQREVAELALRSLAGVRGVRNLLTLPQAVA